MLKLLFLYTSSFITAVTCTGPDTVAGIVISVSLPVSKALTVTALLSVDQLNSLPAMLTLLLYRSVYAGESTQPT